MTGIMKYHDEWNGWKESCRHCNRAISACGELDYRGFCSFCIYKGHNGLYILSSYEKEQQNQIK